MQWSILIRILCILLLNETQETRDQEGDNGSLYEDLKQWENAR